MSSSLSPSTSSSSSSSTTALNSNTNSNSTNTNSQLSNSSGSYNNSLTPIELFGPEKLSKGILIDKGMCCAQTVTTYPQGSQGAKVLCDRFHVKVVGMKTIFALADGCNWGRRSRAAATSAAKAVIEYLSNPYVLDSIYNTSLARDHLLRSFRKAHEKILENAEGGDIWSCGQSTLLAGMILPVDDIFKTTEWALIVVSVGDCKAWIWNPSTGFTDLTYGNRLNVLDPRDPGGRLGPYSDGGFPDLRNISSYFYPCKAGDLVVVTSDGVYDNLDPEHVGLLPVDLSFSDHSWDDLSPPVAACLKSKYMIDKLNQMVAKCLEKHPVEVTSSLIEYCIKVTAPSRAWMEAHPNEREPADYRQFPGKMDHVTAITIKTFPFEIQSERKRKIKQKMKKNNNNFSYKKEPSTREELIELSGLLDFKKMYIAKYIPNQIMTPHPLTPSSPTSSTTSSLSKRDKESQIDSQSGNNGSGSSQDKRKSKRTTKKLPKTTREKNLKQHQKKFGTRVYGPTVDVCTYPLENHQGAAWAMNTDGAKNTTEYFFMETTPNRTSAVLTMGCNSEKSHKISQIVRDYWANALSQTHNITDTTSLGEALLDIVEKSHQLINNYDSTNETDNRVMMIGGLCCQLPNLELGRRSNEWVFVSVNIGNLRALHWNFKTKTLVELFPIDEDSESSFLGYTHQNANGQPGDSNESNSVSTSPSSSSIPSVGSGMIGPVMIETRLSGVRSTVYVCNDEENDAIFLLSPGVFLNFDPMYSGKKPKEFDILVSKKWEKLELERRKLCLEGIATLLSHCTSDRSVSSCVAALMNHVNKVTHQKRLQNEQQSTPPPTTTTSAGYLGQTTCLGFHVGQLPKQQQPGSPPRTPRNQQITSQIQHHNSPPLSQKSNAQQ
eukprot:TRINITY_DN1856_c0_g3_i1.p1 TRINITY_DN1856_c0_g3~~TRINITY_DN1856_c0_g3_i1.p1  ORF type:complete len:1036 (+),score=326.34 TRINITY_DN1856_c0_g3_i1:443-3109(+)